MKKRILLLLIILLVTTGCTCEYNLIIEDNNYKESITIMGENNTEVSNFNRKWNIPIDKEEYSIGTDPDSNVVDNISKVYNYQLSGNNLTFSYNFDQSSFRNSSAVSSCLNTLSVTNSGTKTIISTSSNFTCFDKYPDLDSITINIKIDGQVTSNNANSINNKVYTWYVNRNNYRNTSIDLIFEKTNNGGNGGNDPDKPVNPIKNKKDYTMYIFSGILLLVMLIGYLIFTKIKNNQNNLND